MLQNCTLLQLLGFDCMGFFVPRWGTGNAAEKPNALDEIAQLARTQSIHHADAERIPAAPARPDAWAGWDWCRKRDTRRPDAMAIANLGPPPQPQDPDMLFAALPDPSRLPQGDFDLPPGLDRRRVRARIGRGGGQ